MFNNNGVVAVKKNFKMAVAAILDFVESEFLQHDCGTPILAPLQNLMQIYMPYCQRYSH